MEESYEMALMTLQAYAELQSGREVNPVLKRFETEYPEAVAAARILYKDSVLEGYARDQKSIEKVFNHICYIQDAIITL
jgi:hypothetical protein